MQNWVLPNKYPILPTIMKNGYYPKNTQFFYNNKKVGITQRIPTLSFKTYNLQNDGSILVQTPLSFNRKK